MNLEIERKFLVSSLLFKREAFKKSHIKQGYLNTDKERTVRVRIIDKKGFITVKGKSNTSGVVRFEWEKEIDFIDAEALLQLSENNFIEKIRYFVKSGKHLFEVDEFLGKNTGLIVAEIELNSENEDYIKPTWLGIEVTGQAKYYNAALSKQPFNNWK